MTKYCHHQLLNLLLLRFFILKNTFSTLNMKQLEFEFNSIDLSDYYVAHQAIDEGNNQIFSWE